MTGHFSPPRLIAVAALALLAGCSKDTPPADQGNVAPAYVAVARGRVAVEGGLLQIDAPREGTLADIAVHEGDRVSKGQVLATMDTAPARLQVASATAAVQQAQADATLLDGKLLLAQHSAQRLAAAAKAGAGDGQSADTARGEADELSARKAAAEAAAGLARLKLDEARYELGLRTLHAPIDARVIHVVAQPGASVSPQSGSLFTLLPQTPPIVRAELNESLVDAVTVGMAATVTTDGGGRDQSWPAHVIRIGSVVGPSTLDDDPQQRASARTVGCVLAFDQAPAVRVGQRVLVRFGPPTAPADRAKTP